MVLGGLLASEGAGGQCVGVASSCSPEAGPSGVAGGLWGGPWGGRGLVMWQGACGVAEGCGVADGAVEWQVRFFGHFSTFCAPVSP